MRSIRADARTVAVLSICFLIAAGCGTTVPLSEQQAAEISEDELGGDLTAGTPELPPGARVNDKGQVVSASGEVIGTAEEFGLSPDSGSQVAADDGSVESSDGDDPAVPEDVPGITATTIYVGAIYQETGPANEAAFGEAIDSDARKPYNAMIDLVNKQGGLFGRQVEPVYFKIDGASTQTVDQQMQAACAHWTEDNEVFAILFGGPIPVECAEKAGGISTYTDGASLPEFFETYPHYFETSGLNLVRVGPVTVNGLYRENYFAKSAKVGVVTWDDPVYRASLERGYMPTLEQRGISLATETAYITSPQNAQDLAATSADINSAVLRFQTQGITHVLMIDGPSGACRSGCMGALWMRRSDSQEYTPRYGFNANNAAKAGQEAGLYPARQLRRSVVVEWSDADKFYDEGYKLNQTRERCYKLMRDAGVPLDNAQREADARMTCEQFWFFQLLESILGEAPVTPDNIMVAVNKVGWGFSSPSAYAVHFSPTQHDGIAAARNMKFDDSCTCYQWVSDPYRV